MFFATFVDGRNRSGTSILLYALLVVFILAGVCCAPLFVSLYNEWNAATWCLVSSFYATILFSEKLYRHRMSKMNKTPHDHSKAVMFLSFIGISAGITGASTYIIISVYHIGRFIEDGFGMSLFWSCTTLLWSGILLWYSQKFHLFRRHNPYIRVLTVVVTTLGTLGGIAMSVIFTVLFMNLEASVFAGIGGLFAFATLCEIFYRKATLRRNCTTHNHLSFLFFIGVVGTLISQVAMVYFIVKGVFANEQWGFSCQYVAAIMSGYCLFWSFYLIWTVLYFRATELSVDLFFRGSINDNTGLLDTDDEDE